MAGFPFETAQASMDRILPAVHRLIDNPSAVRIIRSTVDEALDMVGASLPNMAAVQAREVCSRLHEIAKAISSLTLATPEHQAWQRVVVARIRSVAQAGH